MRPARQLLRAAAIACASLFALDAPAWALTFTWTGGGIDNKWTTDANWSGNHSPADFAGGELHTLIFPAGVTKTVMVNDLVAGYPLGTIRFEAPYTLEGTPLRIEGSIVVSYTGNQATAVSAPIVMDVDGLGGTFRFDINAALAINSVLNGPAHTSLRKEGSGTLSLVTANLYQGATIVAGGILDVFHANSLGSPGAFTTVLNGATLRFSGDNLTFTEPIAAAGQGPNNTGAIVFAGNNVILPQLTLSAADVGIVVNNARTARIDGEIAGAVGVIKRGLGTLIFSGNANTYTGLTTNDGGVLFMIKNNGGIAIPAGLLVHNGTVHLGSGHPIVGNVTIDNFGTLNLDGHDDLISGLSGGGALELGLGDLTIESDQDWTFSGTITGSANSKLIKTGSGVLRLRAIAGGIASTLIDFQGLVHLDGVFGGPVEVHDSIRGQGTTGNMTVIGGIVLPGGDLFPALNTKSLKVDADSTVRITPHAPSGNGLTQLRVTGSVTLTNPVLDILVAGQAVQGEQTVIIDNDGTDVINGIFRDLPEGTIFKRGGRTFRISYTGGDGNDVVVTTLIVEYHLSEGATGAFFDTDLLIANPNNTPAAVDVQFLKPGGQTVKQSYLVGATARTTIRVDDVQGLENTEVSAIVTSVDALPLVVERTMRWDTTGYGAHTEKAVGGPSTTWYFAEGAQGFFFTYLLLANPNTAANSATVEYLREGTTPVTRTYPLDPQSRFTVDIGADSELAGRSFGMTVTFTNPGVAERSMYFGMSPLWNAGHESAGVPAPSTSWFLAEGATGAFFETFVLVANPNTDPADATFTFLTESGAKITKTKTIDGRSRLTVNIEAEDPALANAAVATAITSTQPVVVERAQYWPDPAPSWYEAHNSFGVTEAALSWGFAEGRVGGPSVYQTYILLANPETSKSADVTLTFLREGKPSFTKTFTVNPSSRFTVSTGPGTLVPELQDENFGVKIASNEPIVAERAMYSNAGGQVWGAGTNATATRLP